MMRLSIFFVVFLRCLAESTAEETTDAISKYRIVGGHICNAGYEIMVSIRRRKSGGHKCGATLMNPRWILTAAHCEANGDWVTVGLGPDEDFYNSTSGVSSRILDWKPHPDYDAITYLHDVAVARLMKAMNPSTYTWIKFVSLPEAPISGDLDEVCNAGAVTMGWGTTRAFKPEMEHRIRCVTLPVITLKECKTYYREVGHDNALDDTTVCTYTTENKDACQGDSGGPLLCGEVQYGVVSWGSGCAKYPGVFARTDQHLDFIWNSITKGERKMLRSGDVAPRCTLPAMLLSLMVMIRCAVWLICDCV